MTSRFLSQILDANSASVYETLRQHDEDDGFESGLNDIEENTTVPPSYKTDRRTAVQSPTGRKLGASFPAAHYRYEDDSHVVPASLLFEPEDDRESSIHDPVNQRPEARTRLPGRPRGSLAGNLSPSEGRLEEQWQAATANASDCNNETRRRGQLGLIDPKERAMWKWANVENLDNFLNSVYDYYLGKGIYSIMLFRILHLLTLAFVVSFSTFFSLCIDYHAIEPSKTFKDVVDAQCMTRMSGTATILLWATLFYWVIKLILAVVDVRRLWDIHNFYVYLLEIPDSDMQTISWQEVVARLMVLRDANPNTSAAVHRRSHSIQSKQRMDAHDIANRIMRKENYLIALFNKDVLDLTIPFPFLRNSGSILTKTLEWNLNLCIMDFAFNEHGQLRTLFLKYSHRRMLSDGLRRRFVLAGVINVLFAPFIATYFLLVYALKNLNDFIKTPARMGHRQYTPLAEWKFREFNELYHLFQMRLSFSYPAADTYIEQFPKDKTAQIAEFVSFVASALLGVLAIGSIVDYELISGFEIVGGMNAVSCITILGAVVAISRGMTPGDNVLYDPEWSIREVIGHIHYMPSEWNDKLHSDEVKRDFMKLYDLKLSMFLHELLSVIFTPFVLWISLPKCSDQIIDFIRQFTVHVEGVGYVCTFAEFNFQKPGQQDAGDLRKEYFGSKDNKMLTSYMGFMDQYQGTHVGHPYRTASGKRQSNLPYMGRPTSPRGPAEVAAHSANKYSRRPGPVPLGLQDNLPAMNSSLMQSALLDHRHQPATNTLERSMRQTKFQPSPGQSLREEEESSKLNYAERYRSNLGESFISMQTRPTHADEEEDHDKDPVGVLGLLNQFVGAQGPNGPGRPGVV